MKRVLFFLLLSLLIGCAPRGESRQLGEVLDSAQLRYQTAKPGQLADGVAAQLSRVETSLKALTGAPVVAAEIAKSCGEIASSLQLLGSQASYTVRPGLAELEKQFRTCVEVEAVTSASGASYKLLSARLYAVLASELETTRFSVS